ncbi:Oidioi.mRNA.OKI2018_I69.XSR.g15848.t1.cds [Oikopleura dioica]|uniref:Oidioi.mRNA.OKI2018_I69.XSR.g15848.t1.cds n=1 Tax=Oikopleura dioica TaxID=34765 RepID=A0ABN7SEN7_OIKDI|nr:Oidioi.mRNA.OKI2018_I69.XSR.g15848.t1.cds [Oikopleura dioica]
MVVTMPFHPALMADMNGQLLPNFNGGNPWAHHPLTQLSQMGQLANSGFMFWNPTVMNNNSLQLQLQHFNAGMRNRRQRGKYPVPKVEPNSHNNFPRHRAQGLVNRDSNPQEKSKESGIASANTSSQYDGSVGSRFTVQTNTIGQKVKHEPHMSRRMSSTLKSRNGMSHNGTFNQSPIKNEKQSFVLVAGNDSIVVDVEDKGNGPGVTIRQTPQWAEKPPTIKNEEPKSYADLNTKEDQKCNKQDEENQWETEEELQVKPYMPRKGAMRKGVSENFLAEMLPSTVRTVSRQLFKDRPLKRLDPNSTARLTKRVSMNSSINAPVRSNPAGSRSKKKARRISNVKDSAKVLREKRRKQPTIHEDGDVVFTATPVTASSCDDSKENPKKRKGSSFARSLSKIFNKNNKKKGMS